MKLPLQNKYRVYIVGSRWGDDFLLDKFIKEGKWADGHESDINVDKGSLLISYDYGSSSMRVAIALDNSHQDNVKVQWYENPKKNVRSFGDDCPKQQTILEITDNQWFKKIKDFIENNDNWSLSGVSEMQNELINLLIANKNIILHGAPGTGKTYLAREIAKKMIGDEKNFDSQYCMVQFHPSYDYTDFIEGLRPIDDTACNVLFRRKDGTFMEFCRKALNSYNDAKDKDKAPKFVFVIDEINRGDLSKIFGELFFSIEPGYRGEEGKVKTQYCNLWKEEDYFNNSVSFFIPENVYIIGTMNDIDRSVECMDFAMRRRFTFKEISAADSFDMIKNNDIFKDSYNDIEKRFMNLNNYILKIQGLSSAYQIGAAYFLKLENYLEEGKLTDYSWNCLWEYHLKGLLFEYLRGLPNANGELNKLEQAYYC